MKKKDSKKQNSFQLITWNIGFDTFRKINYPIDFESIGEKHEIVRYFQKEDRREFQYIYKISYMNYETNISTNKDIQSLKLYPKIRDKILKLKDEIDKSKINDSFHIQINFNKINQIITVEFITNEGLYPLFNEDMIDLYETVLGSCKYYTKIYNPKLPSINKEINSTPLHDEISLNNFSLSKNRRLKITFFPLEIMIGKKSDNFKLNTYISKYKGKYEYIPPEVFISLKSENSQKSAIYSWAILILDLLRLIPKNKYFEDHQMNETIHNNFIQDLFSPDRINSLQNFQIKNGSDLRNFIMNDLKNCLNFDPSKRPDFSEIFEKIKIILIKEKKSEKYSQNPQQQSPYLLTLPKKNWEANGIKAAPRKGSEHPSPPYSLLEKKEETIELDLIEKGNIYKKMP